MTKTKSHNCLSKAVRFGLQFSLLLPRSLIVSDFCSLNRLNQKKELSQTAMITRSKLVEQLRDYQVRSQHKCPSLTVFSPNPVLSSWADVAVAIFSAILFSVLVVSSYIFLYFRHFWLSFFVLCLGICLPIRLRYCRQAVTRKRDRRLLLPLSM